MTTFSNRLFLFLSILFLHIQYSNAQNEIYLFSYFVDNGQDGLHFAYSPDGLTWQKLNDGKSFLQPTVGKDKLMRDPCITQGADGTYHMVWTSGWNDQIIGYASSKDLIHWSEQKEIPVMVHEPTAKNSWAPEVFYDKKTKQFLIFWATTIPGRHSDIADSENEKGLNHRIYYVTTKDFKTFSKTEMFFNPNFSAIDATIFQKGKWYYMFVKNENPNPPQKNIRITRSRNAAGPYPVEVSGPITGKYWAEGPSPLQVGEYTYLYFDKYTQHAYGAVRSLDMENWEDVSDKVKFPEGVRHGTMFTVTKSTFDQMNASITK
ncbi:glycoside hydrolase family 43 protein [Cytophagaceae bacterium YF14B1]|uniref:Glycoside hydrolase family 43 protein n=1 Tax=Xanthocytophaga flava TaxID=3048013 RepID=A0AAE3UAX5_9BACT|nr:glycoside hydrolase family 43 protein [Xanthocytophaga flavus]MDJ1483798.1 glycoside hydrolase family 43 protein [Xanthocytophaga flavus]